MLFKSLFISLSFLFSSFVVAETVWIDVRSLEEHQINNIKGDIRITYSDILSKVTVLYPDKETDINLYCRSGRRAGIAKSILAEAGYINISNSGGIDSVRKERDLSEPSQ
jgi:phage shock protein E